VAAQRVAEVLAAQERGGARQVSHLTLRLENADGGEDRIRVDLRSGGGLGSLVGARIDVADVSDAGRLAARAGELRDALARHGLNAETLQVGGAGSPAAAARAAAAATEGGATVAAGNAGGPGSSSQEQSSGHPAGRDGASDRPRDAHADGRGDPRHGDARHGRRPQDGWLYDELVPPRRVR
jgi:hypothetical protein